jgi:hypothetical protein
MGFSLQCGLYLQVLPPDVPSPLPDSYKARVALLGCGPASISAATFLGRYFLRFYLSRTV